MSEKVIYVLDAHPYQASFGPSLVNSYETGAREAGYQVISVALRDLDFDPILHYGYKQIQELEPDLQEQQQYLKDMDHLVIITPVWWESVPAQLKGFLDRVFLPGFAFRMKKSRIPSWDKLLTEKSARIIYTQTTPLWYDICIRKDAFFQSLKTGTLNFVGIHPVRRTALNVQGADEKRKEGMRNKVYRLGKQGR